MLKKGILSLLAVLLLMPLMAIKTAWAAEGDKLQLSLKVGSTTAIVNGKKIVIKQPFIENGNVMVPLGVFKKTFGSTVSLEQENVVIVKYGSHTGAMSIGGLTAWKDGVQIKLTSPPMMVEGVLMVPLRFVAGVLGATISRGNDGGLLIMLTPSESKAETTVNTSLDSDVGKTRIGNSYYQWSLNYPSGLVVGDSGGDERMASFMSAENLYYLEVHASIQGVPVDTDQLLDQLVREAEEGGETVLDREISPNDTNPYARIVSKDSSGALWESRGYYAEGRLYEIYLTDDKATNYKDLAKYEGLLNSFQPSFDVKDNTIRDLSTVKEGLRAAYNEDYGISLQVPADWELDDQRLFYESEQGSHLSIKVTSAPTGSTQESWTEEQSTKLRDGFITDAYVIKGVNNVEVSGTLAQVSEFQVNLGDGWMTEYQVLLLKNGYRYYIEYLTAVGQEKDKEMLQAILSSIDIDFDLVKENFGRLESNNYMALRNKSITMTSKKYGYAIDIPRLWTPYEDDFEKQSIEYQFTGGRLQISSNSEGSVEYTVNMLKAYYQNNNNDPKGPKIENVVASTIAGVPATILTVHQRKNGIPFRTKQIVVGNNEVVYTITIVLNDANATVEQQAVLDKTLQSFRFTGSE